MLKSSSHLKPGEAQRPFRGVKRPVFPTARGGSALFVARSSVSSKSFRSGTSCAPAANADQAWKGRLPLPGPRFLTAASFATPQAEGRRLRAQAHLEPSTALQERLPHSSFLHRADVADRRIGSLPCQKPVGAKSSMSDSRQRMPGSPARHINTLVLVSDGIIAPSACTLP